MNSNILFEVLLVAMLLIVGGWVAHHDGYVSGEADAKQALGKAQDANQSCVATISSLKMQLSVCESGRLVDESAQATALAERSDKATRAAAAYEDAASKLQAAMQGTCKTWAKQPACGSVQ